MRYTRVAAFIQKRREFTRRRVIKMSPSDGIFALTDFFHMSKSPLLAA